MRKKLAKWVTNVLLVVCVLALSIGLMACGNVSGTQSGSESAPNSQTSATCNHQVVVDERVEPTCEESGLTSGAHCAICGEVFTQQEEIPANGHSFGEEYSFNGDAHWFECDCGKKNEQSAHEYEWEIVIEATEESDGLKIGACVCGREKTQVIPSKEHEHSYSATVTTPTCTEDGFTTYECACGDSYVTDVILAGHSFSEAGYVAVVPGQTLCEHGGALIQKCKNCGAVREVEEIAPQGHAVDTWIITDPTNGTGRATADCKRCGYYLSVTLPTLASDIYNVETVRLEELCTQKIKTTYTLWANYLDKDGRLLDVAELSKEAGNGAIEISFEVIYASGYHTLGGRLMIEPIIDADLLESLGGKEIPTQKATCTAFGFGSYVCDECGAEMSIPTSRTHNYETDNIAEENVITKPTCDLPGKAKGICTICKKEGRFDIPAMSHELTFIPSADNKRLTITCSNYAEGLVARPCAFHSGVTYDVVGTPEIVEATCRYAGSITYKCDDNGTIKTITLELATTGHKCGDVVVSEGKISIEDLVAGGGQEFTNQKSDCGHTGLGQFNCSDCGENIFVETEKHGEHNIDTKDENYKAPTCTTAGVGYCSGCRLFGSDFLPALGHAYKYVETVGLDGTITLTVTCEREGTEFGCDAAEDVLHIINLSELLANIDEEDVIRVSDPSCTTEGLTQYLVKLEGVLDAMGEPVTYVHEVKIAKENHILNGKEVPHDRIDAEYFVIIGGKEFPTQQANCAKNGYGQYVCEVCGKDVLVETTGESRHLYGEEPIIVLPGCTEPGSETGICIRPGCLTSGYSGKVQKLLPALGHNYQIEVKIAPTHSVDGEAVITCAGRADAEGELVCDDPVEIRIHLPAIDSAPTGYYNSLGKTAPTCSEAGQEKYAARFKVEGIKQRFDIEFAIIIPALGHSMPDVEERLEWTTEKIVSAYIVDETGRIVKDENGNAITYEVLVEERYVGFTCDTCMSTFVISLNTFVNGHEVLDLYTVTYREVSKVIVDAYGNEETKIFAEYVMECVDYNADCIETNHDVIISSYELN